MPLDEAVLDWQVLEPTPGDRRGQADGRRRRRGPPGGGVGHRRRPSPPPACARSGSTSRAFAMIRALAHELPATVAGAQQASYEERMAAGDADAAPPALPARLYCNLGDVTNLAVARGSSCLFTRMSSFGIEGIAQRVAERRELTLEHARQWLIHVGLVTPVEEIEGRSGDRRGVPARRSTRGPRSSPASCASRSTTTAARRARWRSRRSSSADPAPRSPGLPEQLGARARLRASRRPPARRSPHLDEVDRLAAHAVLRPRRWRADGCAPST